MERETFDQTARVEDHHWWFVGRRAILGAVLDSLALPPGATILEAGCGSGGNLPLLARFGETYAFEPDDSARAHAVARGVGTVAPGHLPDAVPFADRRFDLIATLDVLEHLADDAAALAALRDRLTPNGRLVATVAALPGLWSRHDEMHGHYRRYFAHSLRHLAERQGLVVERLTYFNTLLFPIAATTRVLGRLLDATLGGSIDTGLPPGNGVLARIFAAERHLVPRVRLPVGLSLLIVLSGPNGGVGLQARQNSGRA